MGLGYHTGKTGKMAQKNPCQGNTGNLEMLSKHREFCQNTGKTQGMWFTQVENALILKVKDFALFAAKKKSIFFQKLDRSAKSDSYSHKLCKLAEGKFAVGRKTQGI